MSFYKYLSTVFIAAALPAGGLAAQSPDSRETVSLPKALLRAIQNDPRLELNSAWAEAAEGQIEQADLPPNPVVGFEAENFLGTGPVTGVQGLELTLGFSQIVETGGKQQRRTTLARRERDRVGWEREIVVAELEAEVRSAFAEVLLAQEFVDLVSEQLDLARAGEVETERLVKAARSPQVDLTRASLAVKQAEYRLQQVRRELSVARSDLSLLWGARTDVDFDAVGQIELEPELPTFIDLAASLASTAHLARYDALRSSREAALELEKARAVPDVEIFAGGRYYNEEDGNFGFVAGVEVPWPLFDRNQGNIRTARAQLRAVEYEREVVRRERLIALNRAYQTLQSSHAEALSIQRDLLPTAEQALEDTVAGYERGQYTQLDVLSSRETLFDIREAYLEALRRYASAKAMITSMTRPGKPGVSLKTNTIINKKIK